MAKKVHTMTTAETTAEHEETPSPLVTAETKTVNMGDLTHNPTVERKAVTQILSDGTVRVDY